MPSVAVKLYSVFFKFLLKHRLQNRIQAPNESSDQFGVTSRPEESVAVANPSFTDGVATKDIHIDPFTSLSVRIFLPESSLPPPEPHSKPHPPPNPRSIPVPAKNDPQCGSDPSSRRNNYSHRDEPRGNSYGTGNGVEGLNLMFGNAAADYCGYAPGMEGWRRKLPLGFEDEVMY